MSRTAYEAVVVGAGPAGSLCAAHLAAAGLQVALVDRLAPPRYKTCGGGLVWKARCRLPSEVTSVVQRDCHAAELRVEGQGIAIRVEREQPIVSMTMRAELDGWLVGRARESGADLLAPRAVRSVRRVGRELELTTDHGELRAGWVVAADGVGSRVARSTGWPPIHRVAAALESEIVVPASDLERFGAARFDFVSLLAATPGSSPSVSTSRSAASLPSPLRRLWRASSTGTSPSSASSPRAVRIMATSSRSGPATARWPGTASS